MDSTLAHSIRLGSAGRSLAVAGALLGRCWPLPSIEPVAELAMYLGELSRQSLFRAVTDAPLGGLE